MGDIADTVLRTGALPPPAAGAAHDPDGPAGDRADRRAVSAPTRRDRWSVGPHRLSPESGSTVVRTLAALSSLTVALSARLQQYYGRLRHPPGTHHFPA
jgi:hypothetical protein